MHRLSRSLSILCLLLVLPAGIASAQTYDIAAEDWLQPRSGERVRDLPPVSAAVAELRASADARLFIFHQEDEEGALWGTELHDWLVSLGIPPARMVIGTADIAPLALRLEVRQAGHE